MKILKLGDRRTIGQRTMATGQTQRNAQHQFTGGDVRQGSHGCSHVVLTSVRGYRQFEGWVYHLFIMLSVLQIKPITNVHICKYHISGQHSDPRCVYVPPSTGKNFFSFRIAYGRCGTKPDLHGQFYENTVCVIRKIKHRHITKYTKICKLNVNSVGIVSPYIYI